MLIVSGLPSENELFLQSSFGKVSWRKRMRSWFNRWMNSGM